jgi:hypothetical protein
MTDEDDFCEEYQIKRNQAFVTESTSAINEASEALKRILVKRSSESFPDRLATNKRLRIIIRWIRLHRKVRQLALEQLHRLNMMRDSPDSLD